MNDDSLTIVKATSGYSKDIWSWRNDPVTRSMFRSPEIVAWDDHAKWFESALVNPNRFIYVALMNGRPVGMVRFDAISLAEGRFETSINVAPAERKLGIGRKLLAGSIRALRNEISCVKEIVAQVKSTNPASNALFKSAGFLLQAPIEEGYNDYIFKSS